MKYVLSAPAEEDLNEIWEFIAQDKIDAADKWVDLLFAAFDKLALNPGIGHKREDLAAYPILFWPVGAYLILYRVRKEKLEIVAITQGGRDIPSFILKRTTCGEAKRAVSAKTNTDN